MARCLAIFLLLFTALIPVGTASASVILGESNTNALWSGLVGYWPLDGNTTSWTRDTTQDTSGNSNTGNLIGMSTTTSPVVGKIGGALKFNGTNYINVGNDIFDAYTQGSISAWIQFPSILGSGAAASIFEQASASASNAITSFGIYSPDGATVRIRIGGNNNANYIYGNTSLSPHIWYHVVVTSNGSAWQLYVNGVQQTLSVQLGSNGGGWFAQSVSGVMRYAIGVLPRSTGNIAFFNGTIDDVRIYNRALSAQEVAQLYALGQANVAHSNAVTLSTGLVGHWITSGQNINWTADTIADTSGSGNTGTLVNMSTTTSPTAGKIGQALVFNGSTSKLTTSADMIGTSAASVCAWVKPAGSGGANLGRVIDNGKTLLDTGGTTWTFDSDGSTGATYAVPSVAFNKWQFLCSTRDATGITNNYYNGALSGAPNQSSGTPVAGTTNLIIGNRNATDRSFNGAIDDVRVYNRVLSPQEVQQLYALGQANIAHSNTVTLSTGLIGYWPLDGNTTKWTTDTTQDTSGNGNTGTLVGMSTTTSPTPGKIGQALNFNGSQYINLGSNLSLSIPGAGTITAWIKPTISNGIPHWILTTGDNAGDIQFGLEYGRTASKFDTIWGTSGGGFDILSSTASIILNKWQFLAVSRTGSGSSWTANLYINGVLDSTQSGTHTPSLFVNALIGWYVISGGNSSQEFNGAIDDVRIYNRALSAQEVQQLYLIGK